MLTCGWVGRDLSTRARVHPGMLHSQRGTTTYPQLVRVHISCISGKRDALRGTEPRAEVEVQIAKKLSCLSAAENVLAGITWDERSQARREKHPAAHAALAVVAARLCIRVRQERD